MIGGDHVANISQPGFLGTLIEVYAEVRADQIHQPHYSVERYGERLARHAAEPGWETVIGYDGDEPVGYAYVNTIPFDDRWWRRMTTPLPEGTTERSTIALKEIMLRVPWRGVGVARRIHDELLAHRPEEQVSLLVNPLNGNGKVKALYQRWGYREISMQQPSADGPVLTAMLRATREPAPVPGTAE
ncbi:GNAT family N-acetyltransferase [Streptomyces sp. NPDC048639]|uniref:GNAT family N-acetyltransferase n=1 Tax=Streptomyces sp. NPDC048639 TaxID=3365581 RepID=UPI003716E6BF